MSRVRGEMEPVARASALPPAVAVMAKAPGMTVVKSRLHASLGMERATELYRCFLLDRLDAVATLGGIAGVVAFTPLEAEPLMRALAPPGLRLVAQRGADLGERLSSLLSGLLEGGHAGAMAMDSDSPTLPLAYVSEAARLLAGGRHDVVLGPCEDGGYYLIGLGSPQPRLFEGIPWSTAGVLAATQATARALRLRVALLPSWFDVDTERDLRRLHADMAAAGGGPPRTYACVSEIYRATETERT